MVLWAVWRTCGVGGLRQAWPCGASSGVVGACAPTSLCLAAWGWRGGTHCALAALRSNSHRESVTKRAARAQPQAARHSHPGKSPPQGQACRSQPRWLRATGGVPTVLRPRRASPGSGAPLRGAEKRRCRGQRAQRASSSCLRRLFERSAASARRVPPRGRGIEHRREAPAVQGPPRVKRRSLGWPVLAYQSIITTRQCLVSNMMSKGAN